jgi:hypothetical protein
MDTLKELFGDMKELKGEKPLKIEVKQRILLKKNTFICQFYDNYAITDYGSEEIARATFNMMTKNNQKIKIMGSKIREDFKGMKAKKIMKRYIEDIEKAKQKNGRLFSVSYKVIE